ncbi:Uncharacterised protein [Mycobacteroides abscessus subsp. abscessus]|nr:Uncharacterised protein [Mycobacteroides abscessus subsp. abscessus]
MARGDRAGERVVVGSGPAEVRGGRSDDHRGVGDPAGDDDVGAGLQTVHDAPRAEVGVGGQWGAEAELAGTRHEVVALDVCHVDRQPELVGQGAYRCCQAGRIEAAGVGDDLHALVQGQAQRLLQLTQEGLGVAEVGVLGPVPREDQHGQLGEVVAGQVVQLTPGEHLVHRRQPVAIEP